MRQFLYQFISLFISLAILVFFFQLMWILAIPLMIAFLSVWGLNWLKRRWEKLSIRRFGNTNDVCIALTLKNG